MSKKLQVIGEIIKKERNRQKIKKDYVMNKLNISKEYINLIEKGNLDQKISKTITSRYLKIYFELLNIDSKKYLKNYNVTRDKKNKKILKEQIKFFTESKSQMVTSALLLFLIFTVIISNITRNYKIENSKKINNKRIILHRN